MDFIVLSLEKIIGGNNLNQPGTIIYPDGNNRVSKDKDVLLGEYLVTQKVALRILSEANLLLFKAYVPDVMNQTIQSLLFVMLA